jgi:hypothetical protein
MFVVFAKYNENTKWCDHIQDKIIYSKNPNDKNHVSQEQDKTEASSFLKFIIDHYEHLDHEWYCFMHAHEKHWHHPLSQLQSLIINTDELKKKNIYFLNINHDTNLNMMLQTYDVYKNQKLQPSEFEYIEFISSFIELFGDEYDLVIQEFDDKQLTQQSFPPCAQFIVHKNRILNRPKEWYKMVYDWLGDKTKVSNKNASKQYSNRNAGGFFMEAHWHYIFGEPYLYKLPFKTYNDIPML